MITLSLSTLLAVFVAYFLVTPFLARQHGSIGSERSSADGHERNQQMLRDLELDLAMGKLSANEYQVLQRSLEPEHDDA